MSDVRRLLKQARTAIDAKKFDDALHTIDCEILRLEQNNFFANVLKGVCLSSLKRYPEAEAAFDTAIKTHKPEKANPTALLAFQGVEKLNWQVGNTAKALIAAQEIIEIFENDSNESSTERIENELKKITDIAHACASGDSKRLEIFKAFIPGGIFFKYAETVDLNIAAIFRELADTTAACESAQIKKKIAEESTFIGVDRAKLAKDTKLAVYRKSKLLEYLQGIVDWELNDNVRREYELKIFQYKYDNVQVIPNDEKTALATDILQMAKDFVLLDVPYRKAWDVFIEWQDHGTELSLTQDFVSRYKAHFPDSVISICLDYLCKNTVVATGNEPRDSKKTNAAATDAATANVVDSKQNGPAEQKIESPSKEISEDWASQIRELLLYKVDRTTPYITSCRALSALFLESDEYELSLPIFKRMLQLIDFVKDTMGAYLSETRTYVQGKLGTCYLNISVPKFFPMAEELFDKVLDQKPQDVSARIGKAVILQFRDIPTAIQLLETAVLDDHPNSPTASHRNTNSQLLIELAWCYYRTKRYDEALQTLESVKGHLLFPQESQKYSFVCWLQGISSAERNENDLAHHHLIKALKYDANNSAAFSSLGDLYGSQTNDQKRAFKCYMRAFELDAGEHDAAKYLAKYLGRQGDWRLAAMIAERALEKTEIGWRRLSMRRETGTAWPHKTLGVAAALENRWSECALQFQQALRNDTNDIGSWIGLAEAYGRLNKHAAAIKALDRALALDRTSFFARFMKAHFCIVSGRLDDAAQLLSNLLHDKVGANESNGGDNDIIKNNDTDFELTNVRVLLVKCHIRQAARLLDLSAAATASQVLIDALTIATSALAQATEPTSVSALLSMICTICQKLLSFAKVAMKNCPKLLTAIADAQATVNIVRSGDNGNSASAADTEHIQIENQSEISVHKVRGDILQLAVAAIDKVMQVPGKSARDEAALFLERSAVLWNSAVMSSVDKDSLAAQALKAVKSGIGRDRSCSASWTVLGNLLALKKPLIAQHAFIQAIALNTKDSTPWSNLGLLYLHFGERELALESFRRAQALEPELPYAWLGQALLDSFSSNENEQRRATKLIEHAMLISGANGAVVGTARAAMMLYAASNGHLAILADHRQWLRAELASALSIETFPDREVDQVVRCNILERCSQQDNHDSSNRPSNCATNYTGNVYRDELLDRAVTLCTNLELQYEETEDANILRKFVGVKLMEARALLAQHRFKDARDAAQFALDLSSDQVSNDIDNRGYAGNHCQRYPAKVEAQILLAFAEYHLGNFQQSLERLQHTVETQSKDPLLANIITRVLWRHSRKASDIAKTSLLDRAAKSSSNIDICTVGLMAISADDTTLWDTFIELTIPRLMMTDDLAQQQTLVRIICMGILSSALMIQKDNFAKNVQTLRRLIVLLPNNAILWISLCKLRQQQNEHSESKSRSSAIERQQIAEVAIAAALRERRSVSAANTLAEAYSLSRERKHTQRAMLLAPTMICPSSHRVAQVQ